MIKLHLKIQTYLFPGKNGLSFIQIINFGIFTTINFAYDLGSSKQSWKK